MLVEKLVKQVDLLQAWEMTTSGICRSSLGQFAGRANARYCAELSAGTLRPSKPERCSGCGEEFEIANR